VAIFERKREGGDEEHDEQEHHKNMTKNANWHD
jgi:hypothetical protein